MNASHARTLHFELRLNELFHNFGSLPHKPLWADALEFAFDTRLSGFPMHYKDV